jgi:glutamine cyclotransferase
VLDTFPHDPDAFTEGFEFRKQRLYEGTGLEGTSDLRRVRLSTGEVLRSKPLDDQYFGEGITIFGDRIYQLTWQEHTAFVYDRTSWEQQKTFTYDGEGWGLTHNSRRLVMSNGSHIIYFRKPGNFDVTRTIAVTEGGQRVAGLNELEWVNGDILANIFPTNQMVRIDPANGNVLARYDLSDLQAAENRSGNDDVPNGIAYMNDSDRLFVTGKYWQHVYEIEL